MLQLKLNSFRIRSNVAAFDYDHTLVKPKSGGTFPKDVDDWMFLQESVPIVLEQLYKKGYALVIFTNQTKDWKIKQIENVLTSLNLPIMAVIATTKETQKPSTAMYDTYLKSDKLKLSECFFVGDALGRPNDWSDTDKQFAEAIGFQVKTPEELFVPETKGTNSSQEIVVLIGYPGSGKSHFANCFYGINKNYVVLHGDQYKTSTKMISVAKPLIESGKSIVFDATNPTIEKRKEYINLAKKYNLFIRCIHITTSMEESLLRNNSRPSEQIVPKIAYYVYKKKFEEPTMSEGFNHLTSL
jgi:bifunctional polynucleotide phosphatase/kinase